MRVVALTSLTVLLLSPVALADGLFHGPHQVVRTPGRTLELVLEGSKTMPKLRATEWIVYSPAAPDHELQDVTRSKLEVWTDRERSASVTSRTKREGSAQARDMLFLRHKPRRVRDRVHYRLRIELREYKLALAPGKPKTLPKLSSRERTRYLAPSRVYAFQDRAFQAWLHKTGLLRKRGERDLDFAFRTLQAIAKGFEYRYPPKLAERRCTQVLEEKASDCGGLSFLFVSVMRANRIPARALVGRWSEPDKSKEPQYHVKAEFLAHGVGWVPIDASGAVTWKGGARSAFGKLGGPFVVLHVDTGLLLDSVHWGKHTIDWLQSPILWARGDGSFEGEQATSTWTVRGK